MDDIQENSTGKMEWATGSWSGFNFRSIIHHSTPKQYRPLPPASPNLSIIHNVTSAQIEEVTELFARLSLK